MSPTSIALIGLVMWYVFTAALLAGCRAYLMVATKKAANTFATNGSDMPGFGQRVTRVHANAYENIPFYIGVLLYAQIAGKTAITDLTAMWLLYARIAQGIVHLSSLSVWAVQLRFLFFAVQWGIVIYWLYRFLAG